MIGKYNFGFLLCSAPTLELGYNDGDDQPCMHVYLPCADQSIWIMQEISVFNFVVNIAHTSQVKQRISSFTHLAIIWQRKKWI